MKKGKRLTEFEVRISEIEKTINADPRKAGQQLAALKERFPEEKSAGDYCSLLIGRCLQRQGRGTEALALISPCTQALENAGAAREASLGYHYMSQIHAGKYDLQSALECAVHGLDIARKTRDWDLQMCLYIDLCPVYLGFDDYQTGLDCYLKSKDIFENHILGKVPSTAGPDSYISFIIDLNIAILYHKTGRYQEAISCLDGISESVKTVLGGMYIDQFNIEYAHACFGMGLVEKGVRSADAVIGKLERDQNTPLYSIPMNCLDLCNTLQENGEMDRALKIIGLIRPAIERENDPRILSMAFKVLARCHEKTGQTELALSEYSKCLEFRELSDKRKQEDNRLNTIRRVDLQNAVDRQNREAETREREVIRLKQEMDFKTQQEEILINISENTDFFFLLFSPENQSVDFVSRNSLRLFGFDVQHSTALCSDLFSWLHLDEEKRRLFLSGALTCRCEDDCRTTNPVTGSELFVHVEMTPTNQGHQHLLMLSDTTQVRQNQDSLTRAIGEARKASQAKTLFLSNMSHDIRTPLNVIIGLNQMMRDNLHNPEALEGYLTMSSKSSQHLLALINDILDMTRIESGKITLTPRSFSLEAFVQNTIEIIRPQYEVKEQTVSVDAEGIEDLWITADDLRLKQIFLNILGNSVKFTPNCGSIILRIRTRNSCITGNKTFVFEFIDNGKGMSEEFAQKVFLPFEREENSVRAVEGTGLGMSITKSLVDLMKGSISVVSAEGRGSTFTIVLDLPFQKITSAPQTAEPDSHPLGKHHSGSVLMAEDNAVNSMIANYLLRKLGCRVTSVENGLLAVQTFQDSEPGTFDLILMDIRMPVLDGYGATIRIRSTDRPDAASIPIIALTADAFVEDVKHAIDCGMNEHISKPIDPAVLENILDRYLNRHDPE